MSESFLYNKNYCFFQRCFNLTDKMVEKMVENETDAKPFGNVAMNKENDLKAILFFFFCGTKINYPYYPLD